MQRKKGRLLYVPAPVIDEIGDIKRENKLTLNCEAFNQLVGYARVGREAERISRLDFSRKQKLPDLNSYPKKWKRVLK